MINSDDYTLAEKKIIDDLNAAAFKGDNRGVNKIIGKYPVDTDIIGRALFYAILADKEDIARKLIDIGANVDVKVVPFSFTPLTCALRKGCVEVVKLILNTGIKIDIKSENNNILALAIKDSNEAILKLLLDRAETSIATKIALNLMMRSSDEEIIKLLLLKVKENNDTSDIGMLISNMTIKDVYSNHSNTVLTIAKELGFDVVPFYEHSETLISGNIEEGARSTGDPYSNEFCHIS